MEINKTTADKYTAKDTKVGMNYNSEEEGFTIGEFQNYHHIYLTVEEALEVWEFLQEVLIDLGELERPEPRQTRRIK